MFTMPLVMEEKPYLNIPVSSHRLMWFSTKDKPRFQCYFPHIHLAVEFLYIRRGAMTMCIGGDTFTATAGTVVVTNTCELHSAYVDASHGFVEYSYFLADLHRMMPNIEPSLIGRIMDQELRFRRFVCDDEIRTLIDAMPELVLEQKQDGTAELAIFSNVFRTIVRLSELGMICRTDEYAKKATQFNYRVMEFLNTWYAEDISSELICRHFHYNYSYFCRLFKKHFGQPFHMYLEQYRINRAMELLQRGKEYAGSSIGELAARVGIPDNSRFSHSFKKIVGMSPTEYKNSRSM